MNIPAFFIGRPVATSLLAIAIALSGVLAYFRLPVAPLPNVTMPVIVVQASMAGASPDIMASTVAEPLERRLATIAGVTELTSVNSVGTSMVIAQFAINRDINGAARDVEAGIQAARADLPTTLRGNPSYRKYNPADSPIIILSLTSSTLTTAQFYDSADTVIQQQLSQITGVGQIQLGGSALPSVRVELEPEKLSSYGIGLEDVRAAISSANADSAKGYIDQGDQRYEVMSNDQATKAADYQDLVIAYRKGAPVMLHDVAAVVDSNENIRNAGLFNNQPTVGVIVFPLPGCEHHQDRRTDQEGTAVGRGNPAAQHQRAHRHGPVAVGDRGSGRHRAQPHDRRGAGHRRGVRVPAIPARDAHPGGGIAHLDPGHVRPDVPARLQHRQSVADGAHHRHRFRRRRRCGGARERGALCRIGHERAGSRPARERRGELHGGLHEHLADRGVHSRSCCSRASSASCSTNLP